MNTYNLIIFPFIYFFLNTSPHFSISENSILAKEGFHKIYFIKQNWHTAIVFKTQELDSDLFREFESFSEFSLIDIGWGDEEFYQYPGFDSGLAFKALFYATPSTLRVEGINLSNEEYFYLSEIVIELNVSDEQFKNICIYINKTFYTIDKGETLILSRKAEGKIIFYKANGYYHLFNTCNTWLAKGLREAGLDIEDNILLTEQLFNELARIGTVIKSNQPVD
ncbi:MAG: DUF2459 domain-containing protein [Ignavibacteria bacterium]|nr:DUF2459 domain-containing protein [Ignavibacteria bacterium]